MQEQTSEVIFLNKNDDDLTIYTENGKIKMSRKHFNEKLPKNFDENTQRDYVLDLLIYGDATYNKPKHNSII
jgi:hypothetical protein